jgi:hypothetical protein
MKKWILSGLTAGVLCLLGSGVVQAQDDRDAPDGEGWRARVERALADVPEERREKILERLDGMDPQERGPAIARILRRLNQGRDQSGADGARQGRDSDIPPRLAREIRKRLQELDEADRQALIDEWRQADREGRWELLSNLFSEEELAELKKLRRKGDDRADDGGARRFLRNLPEGIRKRLKAGFEALDDEGKADAKEKLKGLMQDVRQKIQEGELTKETARPYVIRQLKALFPDWFTGDDGNDSDTTESKS